MYEFDSSLGDVYFGYEVYEVDIFDVLYDNFQTALEAAKFFGYKLHIKQANSLGPQDYIALNENIDFVIDDTPSINPITISSIADFYKAINENKGMKVSAARKGLTYNVSEEVREARIKAAHCGHQLSSVQNENNQNAYRKICQLIAKQLKAHEIYDFEATKEEWIKYHDYGFIPYRSIARSLTSDPNILTARGGQKFDGTTVKRLIDKFSQAGIRPEYVEQCEEVKIYLSNLDFDL